MTRLILAVCLALATTLCLTAVSEAHKVNIFAYVDGDTIVTDSGYSRTNRVYKGVVEVYDAGGGGLLLSGNTDTEGRFTFPIPAEARDKHLDLRLLLKAGSGHQAEWTVKYAEFGDAETPVAAEAAEAGAVVARPGVQPVVGSPAAGGVSAAEVEGIVRRQLEPVKRMLADISQPGPSVTEIIGGIGWILGLFGIAAYMKSRKKAE